MSKEIEELKEEVKLLRDMLAVMAEANGMKFRKGEYDLPVSPSVSLVPIKKTVHGAKGGTVPASPMPRWS